jgi:hypothetical protein
MTSSFDPHEAGGRLGAHAKNQSDEDFLHSLNEHVRHLPVDAAVDEDTAERLPIVYIVGAPRSGTTLLSQVASRYLEVGYINNLIARFWLRPSVGIRLSAICLGPDARRAISFSAMHGVTREIEGPHEFGYFWRHWLGLDAAETHHLTPEESSRVDVDGLRRTLVGEILASFDLPVVFKNVICGFQARLLSAAHPRSLFVHIHRDPVATACSILAARKARYGDETVWWSLKPAAFAEVRRADTPLGEIAAQVYHCRREMDQELASDGVNSLDVSYEALCASPLAVLQQISERVAALGTAIAHVDRPVERLTASLQANGDPSQREFLRAYFASRASVD